MLTKKGFTILELMVAIVVISIGVLGAYSVVQQIFADTFIASSRLTAAYLAQEQIELVRNERDVNWITDNPDWKEGLDDTDWEEDTGWFPIPDFNNYERKTTITFIDPELRVKVEVKWSMRGKNGIITVQENLYDWKTL